MLQDILNLNIFAFFLVFARIGTALMLLPGLGAAYVSPRIRLSIALGLAFAAMPALGPTLPAMPATPSALGILLAGEALIGTLLGMIARILIAALQTAGTMISLLSSLSNAFVTDPVAEQQSSIISGFLSTLGITLIFVTDAYQMMFRAVADSYVLFVPGEMPPLGDFSDTITRMVAESFALGLKLSTPVLIAALTYYIGLGILGRLMPTLHVFFFGLPAQIALQIWLMMATLSGAMIVFMTSFREGLAPFLAG